MRKNHRTIQAGNLTWQMEDTLLSVAQCRTLADMRSIPWPDLLRIRIFSFFFGAANQSWRFTGAEESESLACFKQNDEQIAFERSLRNSVGLTCYLSLGVLCCFLGCAADVMVYSPRCLVGRINAALAGVNMLVRSGTRLTSEALGLSYRPAGADGQVETVRCFISVKGMDEPLGVMPTSEALQRAEDEGLDLVMISPGAEPPVVKIIDYGKFK